MKKNFYAFTGKFTDIVLFMIALVVGAWLQNDLSVDSAITAYVILFAIAFVMHSIAAKVRNMVANSIETQEIEDETEIKD